MAQTVHLPRGQSRVAVQDEQGTMIGTAVVDNATGKILQGSPGVVVDDPEPKGLMESLSEPGPLGIPTGGWLLGAGIGLAWVLRS